LRPLCCERCPGRRCTDLASYRMGRLAFRLSWAPLTRAADLVDHGLNSRARWAFQRETAPVVRSGRLGRRPHRVGSDDTHRGPPGTWRR
jgi:hypothetical protein